VRDLLLTIFILHIIETLAAPAAQAQQATFNPRIALVIGNATYRDAALATTANACPPGNPLISSAVGSTGWAVQLGAPRSEAERRGISSASTTKWVRAQRIDGRSSRGPR
jgi:hypothetical protein